MGRRPGTNLNHDVLEKIIEVAEMGSTNYVIASAIGIHPDTFQTWLKRGKDTLRDQPVVDEETDRELNLYEELFLRLEQTRALLAAEMSNVVIETAKSRDKNTWQAAMTFLERRYPNDWGKRETYVHEGDAGATLPQINILVLNDPSARSAHRDLLRSVDNANRARAGVPIGPSVGGELEAGPDGSDDISVDAR